MADTTPPGEPAGEHERPHPEDPLRTIAEEASAAFESGMAFLADLHRRYGEQLGPDPLAHLAGRMQDFAATGRAAGGATRPAPAPERRLVVDGLEPSVRERFTVAAGARALDHAAYLAALVRLHEECRKLADTGEAPELAGLLDRLGLATVTT